MATNGLYYRKLDEKVEKGKKENKKQNKEDDDEEKEDKDENEYNNNNNKNNYNYNNLPQCKICSPIIKYKEKHPFVARHLLNKSVPQNDPEGKSTFTHFSLIDIDISSR